MRELGEDVDTFSCERTGSKKVEGHNVSLSTLCLAFIK